MTAAEDAGPPVVPADAWPLGFTAATLRPDRVRSCGECGALVEWGYANAHARRHELEAGR